MRFVTLIALPLALGASNALAQTASADREPISTRVSLKHLDLTTPQGQRAAIQRVERAANALCARGGRVTVYEAREAALCEADALASGRAAAARAIAAAQGRAPMVASTNAPAAGTR